MWDSVLWVLFYVAQDRGLLFGGVALCTDVSNARSALIFRIKQIRIEDED